MYCPTCGYPLTKKCYFCGTTHGLKKIQALFGKPDVAWACQECCDKHVWQTTVTKEKQCQF
jgi:hypothetical protein